MQKRRRRVLQILLVAIFGTLFQAVPSQAAFYAPSFPKIPVQIVADNDYAIMLGNELGPTSVIYKNSVVWGSQIASAAVIDVTPGVSDSYLYVLAIGGGGDENWGGTINGQDVIYYPGAQVAINPIDPQEFKSYWINEMDPFDPFAPPNLTQSQAWVTKYLDIAPSIVGLSDHQSGCTGSGCDTVSNGGYSEPNLVSYVQSGISSAEWTGAFYDGSQYQPEDQLPISNLPRPKTSMFGQCVACDAAPNDGSGRAWEFPSKSAVLFRYPIANIYNGVLAPITPGNEQVVLNWNPPNGGDTPAGYLVQFKTHTDSNWTDFEYTASINSTVTGLTNGVNYDFRVRAASALDPSAQLGPASNIKSSTPLSEASAPTILTNTSTASSVSLTFALPSTDGGLSITNYEYSTDDGATWFARSPASTSTTISITNESGGSRAALNLNNYYQFKLRAVTGYGVGQASSPTSTYKINYNLNGGAGATPSERSHFEGETFALASAPTRTNYRFNGWFDGSQIYSIPFNSSNYTMDSTNPTLTAQWLSLVHPISRTGSQNNNSTAGELWSWFGNNVHTLSDVLPGWCVTGGTDHSPSWVVNSVIHDQQSTTINTNTDFTFSGGSWTFSPDPSITFTTGGTQSVDFGSAITSTVITNSACEANKFTVSPSLPAGLSLDSSTGVISGTPLSVQTSTSYVVTAERWVDTSTGVLDLSGTKIGYSTATFTMSVSIPGYSVTYLRGTGGSGTLPTEGQHLQGETFTVSSGSGLSRSGFYISHWSDGSSNYLPGATYTVGTQNVTLTPNWRQNSLRGIEDGSLTLAGTIVSSSITSTTTTVSAGSNSVSIQVPSGSFTDSTTVTIYSLSNASLAQSLISQNGDYVVNLVVAWLASNGTVPNANTPIVVTINNSDIQVGATIYEILNGTATAIGTTTQAGRAVVNLTSDPVITVANPAVQPSPPVSNSSSAPSTPSQTQSVVVKSVSPVSGSTKGGTIVSLTVNSFAGCAVTNVSVSGELLNHGDWKALGNEISITMPAGNAGLTMIQIYNSCVPLLSPIDFTYVDEPKAVVPTPTPKPTATPTPSPTPKPTTNTQPAMAMKKLGAAYFEVNSFTLNAAAKVAIKDLATRIMASSATQVLLYGNSDAQPSPNNELLSKKRAYSVLAYIRPLLNEKKISVGWYSASKPAVKGKSAAAYAKNRRVEVWVK